MEKRYYGDEIYVFGAKTYEEAWSTLDPEEAKNYECAGTDYSANACVFNKKPLILKTSEGTLDEFQKHYPDIKITKQELFSREDWKIAKLVDGFLDEKLKNCEDPWYGRFRHGESIFYIAAEGSIGSSKDRYVLVRLIMEEKVVIKLKDKSYGVTNRKNFVIIPRSETNGNRQGGDDTEVVAWNYDTWICPCSIILGEDGELTNDKTTAKILAEMPETPLPLGARCSSENYEFDYRSETAPWICIARKREAK